MGQDRETARSIEDVADFVRHLTQLQEETPDVTFWFRGQSQGAPELQPAVLRPWFLQRVAEQREAASDDELQARLLETEIGLNRSFRRLGAAMLPHGASLVEVYFLAQHHGMPTRLLDWTTNPLAALFFAVRSRAEHDGVVLSMIPRLPSNGGTVNGGMADTRSAPLDVRHPLVVKTIANLFGESEEAPPGVVLPVVPDLVAGRIQQQGSCFTLHTPGAPPICWESVEHFVVPKQCKPNVERGLRSVGISWSTLFPDLDHLAREIRVQGGYWPENLA